MAAADEGRICAINFLPLKQGAAIGDFEKFSAELDQPTCLIDSSCVTTATLAQISSFRQAVAHLEYVKNGSGFVCSKIKIVKIY